MKYTVIINPSAGNGITKKQVSQITDLLLMDRCRVLETDTLDDIKMYIENYSQETECFVFVGGDGTLREALKQCTNLNVKQPIGIIPNGSGNDLVRSLGIPNDISDAIDIILDEHYEQLYIACLNDDYYVNIASMGLDAEIANLQHNLKSKLGGRLSYVVSALIKIFTYKAKSYTVIVDGVSRKVAYKLVAVANGKYYGGGMKIAPDADPFSKDLVVCGLKKTTRFLLPFILPLVYSGRHINLWCVDYFKCQTITINSEEESLLNMDGEIYLRKFAKIQKMKADQLKILLSKSRSKRRIG